MDRDSTSSNHSCFIDCGPMTKKGQAFPTKEEDTTTELIERFNCFAIFAVVPFGIVANILNILVLSKGNIFSRSTTIAVLSLAVIDLIFLMTMPMRRIECLLAEFDKRLANWMRVHTLTYGVKGINRNCARATLAHIPIISLERVLAVYFPLSVNRIVTPRRMSIVIASLYTLNLGLSAPNFFIFSFRKVIDAATNQTNYVSTFTEFFRRNGFFLIPYDRYLLNNLRGPLSMTIVITSSVAIGIKLFMVTKQRSAMSSQKKIGFDFKVAKTLLTICVIYIFVGIPNTIQNFLTNFSGTTGTFSDFFYSMALFNDLLYVINSSANFIVYFSTSTKFSTKLKEILCQKKKTKK